MHRCTTQSAGQIIGQVAGLQVIGLDIAKSVFQLHTVDMSTGEIVNVLTCPLQPYQSVGERSRGLQVN